MCGCLRSPGWPGWCSAPAHGSAAAPFSSPQDPSGLQFVQLSPYTHNSQSTHTTISKDRTITQYTQHSLNTQNYESNISMNRRPIRNGFRVENRGTGWSYKKKQKNREQPEVSWHSLCIALLEISRLSASHRMTPKKTGWFWVRPIAGDKEATPANQNEFSLYILNWWLSILTIC